MYSKLFKLIAILAVITMLVAPVSAQAPLPTDEVVDGKYQAVTPDKIISIMPAPKKLRVRCWVVTC